jgi:hypothetical protein
MLALLTRITSPRVFAMLVEATLGFVYRIPRSRYLSVPRRVRMLWVTGADVAIRWLGSTVVYTRGDECSSSGTS